MLISCEKCGEWAKFGKWVGARRWAEGKVNESYSETCPACDGYGEVAKYGNWRDIQNRITCIGCGGSGEVTPEKADEIRAFQRYGPDER